MKTEIKKFRFNDYKFGELYSRFGITATHFMPFDNQSLENYGDAQGLTEEEYLQQIKNYLYSTVYQGIRYFFETPEQLKEFCKMVEG
ncbi:MAG: hypothetical protein WCY19_05140 [Candidatus Gastranaerophilaceae bacterium]